MIRYPVTDATLLSRAIGSPTNVTRALAARLRLPNSSNSNPVGRFSTVGAWMLWVRGSALTSAYRAYRGLISPYTIVWWSRRDSTGDSSMTRTDNTTAIASLGPAVSG